ncbi:MAG TPA: hypothetical protein VGJ27_01220 [Gaiellaceae bacterium]
MRRAGALLVALAALALPGGAEANGDPASDVLLTTQVFLPFEAPISDSAASDLKQTVAAANEKGYTIRVAVIAFTGDLGTAVSLWRRPQDYSKFLGSEIAFVYKNRLLVAMPSGFGFYNGRKPVPKELGVLAKVKPGKTPTPLTESAAEAVRALAASAGVTVAKPSSGSSPTRDRLILAAAVLAFLLVLFFPTRLLRRRRAQGAER